MEFTCTAQQSGRHLDVTVTGDVDLTVYTRFEAEAATWAANGSDVRLNCSGVTFMDSMGLRVLVGLWQNLTDADRTVTLIDPSERVSRVLDLAGVTQLFEQGTPVFEQGTPEPARDAAA
jgi:anti-anti-sigma factor